MRFLSASSRTFNQRAFTMLLCAVAGMAWSSFRAQAQDATAISPSEIAAQIKPLHHKTLVLVFDVSQSTRSGGVFQMERSASATLIRQGCSLGDRVVMEKFGTGYATVFDKRLASASDASELIDQLPPSPEPGRGTNIRWPHHEALKIAHESLPNPTVIVLLTDSFNDRPVPEDPNYPRYLSYYTLNGLTVYPNTQDNRSYEGLLRTLKNSGKLHEFGVGVGIAPSGRPIERLPVTTGQGDTDDSAQTLTPTILQPTTTEKPHSNLPLILGGIAAAITALLAAFFATGNRPIPVRLAMGGALSRTAPRDYRLRPGSKIGLGGSVTTVGPSDESFPIAGLATPAAWIQGARGGATLVPIANSDTTTGPRVYHNGAPLERAEPLRIEDEIRILIPSTDMNPEREQRVRFLDPKADTL